MGLGSVAAIVAGVGLVVLGLGVAFLGRRQAVEEVGARGVSPVARVVVGMSLAGVGYHAMGWAAGWGGLLVPIDRWWLVALVAGLAVVGALVGDRLEGGSGGT